MAHETLKMGVLGFGMRGGYFAYEILKCSNIKLAAICDCNEKQALEAAKMLKENGLTDVHVFRDYSEMLNEADIDAVLVCNHAPEHTPAVIAALEAGKHVLSEIPAVTSVEEARMLKRAVLDHPKQRYMFAENCCYWVNMEAWKTMREAGKFGEIVCAEAEYLHACEPSDIKPEQYAGKDHWRMTEPAIRYITHELGPLLEIMDDRVIRVVAMEPTPRYNPYISKSENAAALFFTEKGAVIRILICFGAYCSYTHNYRLIGTKGTIETDRIKCIDEAYSYAALEEIPGTFMKKTEIPITISQPGGGEGGHGGADRKLLLDFAQCVLESKEPHLNVDKAIQFSLPGVLAHESALQGGVPIDMPEI